VLGSFNINKSKQTVRSLQRNEKHEVQHLFNTVWISYPVYTQHDIPLQTNSDFIGATYPNYGVPQADCPPTIRNNYDLPRESIVQC
jgi:hypothetical protein